MKTDGLTELQHAILTSRPGSLELGQRTPLAYRINNTITDEAGGWKKKEGRDNLQ